jgi:hypothetical protein
MLGLARIFWACSLYGSWGEITGASKAIKIRINRIVPPKAPSGFRFEKSIAAWMYWGRKRNVRPTLPAEAGNIPLNIIAPG